ncbi:MULTISPECIES: hypothetical protein [unclassified Brucella]|uniref:hypothetical protein n=1 Tax=unclassified Brucella TaxID=2632610 RepID=UPI0012ADE4B9|nr:MULTISPECIES: hypothetical protein [unclassified Brucella]MRN44640.1 hypothetical protein [Brucella sp. 09RB8913]MRN58632.1 hypothetical protein [Brucella sp. 09RB8918]
MATGIVTSRLLPPAGIDLVSFDLLVKMKQCQMSARFSRGSWLVTDFQPQRLDAMEIILGVTGTGEVMKFDMGLAAYVRIGGLSSGECFDAIG